MKQNKDYVSATFDQWETFKKNFANSFIGAKVTKNRITLENVFVAKFLPYNGVMEYNLSKSEMIFARFPEK